MKKLSARRPQGGKSCLQYVASQSAEKENVKEKGEKQIGTGSGQLGNTVNAHIGTGTVNDTDNNQNDNG